jgi:cell division protein FtsB
MAATSGQRSKQRKRITNKILAVRVFIFALLVCLGSVHSWAQKNEQQQNEQQQMRGLDEQVQEIKSDALSIAQELNRLEEKLLYPSGTQVAIFIALTKGDMMRLDAVRLQIDGQLVAHHIYSFKELEALRKGGVQRIYVGNVTTGDHQLEVLVDGKLEDGADFSRTEHFNVHKEVKPKLVGLTLAGPRSGNTPIALGEW